MSQFLNFFNGVLLGQPFPRKIRKDSPRTDADRDAVAHFRAVRFSPSDRDRTLTVARQCGIFTRLSWPTDWWWDRLWPQICLTRSREGAKNFDSHAEAQRRGGVSNYCGGRSDEKSGRPLVGCRADVYGWWGRWVKCGNGMPSNMKPRGRRVGVDLGWSGGDLAP